MLANVVALVETTLPYSRQRTCQPAIILRCANAQPALSVDAIRASIAHELRRFGSYLLNANNALSQAGSNPPELEEG